MPMCNAAVRLVPSGAYARQLSRTDALVSFSNVSKMVLEQLLVILLICISRTSGRASSPL